MFALMVFNKFNIIYIFFSLGNGDLATKILGSELDGTTGTLDKLYKVSNTLIQTKKTIIENKNSIAIETINKNLDDLKVNFQDVTNLALYGTDAIVNQFGQYNKWTNYETPDTYQKSCSSNSNDFWTTSLTKCENGYVKVNGGTAAGGDKNCLILSEWSSSQQTARYTIRPEGCSTTTGSSDFNTVKGAASAYYSSFNTFSASNSLLIDQIEKDNGELNTTFTSMSTKLLNLITSIDGIISPLVDLFNKFVGDAGIFQLVNCSNLI